MSFKLTFNGGAWSPFSASTTATNLGLFSASAFIVSASRALSCLQSKVVYQSLVNNTTILFYRNITLVSTGKEIQVILCPRRAVLCAIRVGPACYIKHYKYRVKILDGLILPQCNEKINLKSVPTPLGPCATF